jgi:hypothetical protein
MQFVLLSLRVDVADSACLHSFKPIIYKESIALKSDKVCLERRLLSQLASTSLSSEFRCDDEDNCLYTKV